MVNGAQPLYSAVIRCAGPRVPRTEGDAGRWLDGGRQGGGQHGELVVDKRRGVLGAILVLGQSARGGGGDAGRSWSR